MHLRADPLTSTRETAAADLAIVLVHYDTPRLAADAVRSLRDDVHRSGVRASFLIVDNGSDAAGAEMLRALDVPVIAPGRNLGYAGGVNLGVSRMQAPFVIIMNPDVFVRPGCIAALCGALREGAAAAGPRFCWDEAGRLLLPPTERRDVTSAALARLGVRGPRWARAARRRWRRHARRHWLAREPLPSHALSGALLAFRRDAWDAIGPFDEGFRLYFEETDWLMRLARSGRPARYVPAARARHTYNQSARRQPEADAWFAASARRFDDRYFGRAARWLRRLERVADSPEGRAYTDPRIRAARVDADGAAVDVSPITATSAAPLWIELSSGPAGYPAAAECLADGQPTWRVPGEVWEDLAPGSYLLRLVDAAGREREAFTFHR